ncbi:MULTISPECIES: hypothetical protein [Burkholderia]|uniref:hypothetical protein n=1 Tax=Burkholderia TaxID=32008 RepID=UPI0008414413|nr:MULTISPECIES: hypothetical protein [unclassified Burkholderia]AOK29088.1 hypothetical protein AQ611_06250 [Burkholderia sp. Bp7605]
MNGSITDQLLQAAVENIGKDVQTPIDTPAAHLVERFRTLMQQAPMVAPEPTESNGTIVLKLAKLHDGQLQQAVNHINQLSHSIPYLTTKEVIANSAYMMKEIATVQANMSVKIAVVHSSKSALDTLMRNQ